MNTLCIFGSDVIFRVKIRIQINIKRETMNFSTAKKIGLMAILVPLFATSASAYTTAEYAAHKKGCEGQGGTVGIYSDGRLGCHMGVASKLPANFKVIKNKKEFEALAKQSKSNVKQNKAKAAGGGGKVMVQDLMIQSK
ncbi:hypothetical protein WNY59_01655 [Ahrensia kielensis]|uniref:Uncharacterized protein n=1 Tax=Ahrensia kielensis TaxID=76980 RepID=A0ABU9T2D9_9HYPH